jgi:hypothetical protein
MKALIIALSFFSMTFQAFAGPGGGGGGVGTTPTLRVTSGKIKDLLTKQGVSELKSNLILLKKDDIEALRSIDGSYTRFSDLEDGFVTLKGAKVSGQSIVIAPQQPRSEVKSIIFDNGQESSIENLNF